MDEKIDVKTMPSRVLLSKFLDSFMFKEDKLEEYREILNEVKSRLDGWQCLKDFLEGEK